MPNSLATAFDPSPSRTGTGLNAVSFHSSKEKHFQAETEKFCYKCRRCYFSSAIGEIQFNTRLPRSKWPLEIGESVFFTALLIVIKLYFPI